MRSSGSTHAHLHHILATSVPQRAPLAALSARASAAPLRARHPDHGALLPRVVERHRAENLRLRRAAASRASICRTAAAGPVSVAIRAAGGKPSSARSAELALGVRDRVPAHQGLDGGHAPRRRSTTSSRAGPDQGGGVHPAAQRLLPGPQVGRGRAAPTPSSSSAAA